jgi:protein-S-isoprenylcysteine O-methyltransferase Ste14
MIHTLWYQALVWAVLGVSPLVLAALLLLPAPYGRHATRSFGPTMPTRWAWIVMESPSVFLFAAVFALGPRSWQPVPLLMLALWQAHYVQRTLIYPFLLRTGNGGRTAVAICAMGFAFNCANATINAGWIASDEAGYSVAWLADPRFIVGASLFVLGYAINRWADGVLRNLRKPGETGYRIPRGGLYERISAPNYFGEIVEWTGWAIATWSLPGLAFALFTVANLLPRGITHHRWYREKFPDYPRDRKAVIPFVL